MFTIDCKETTFMTLCFKGAAFNLAFLFSLSSQSHNLSVSLLILVQEICNHYIQYRLRCLKCRAFIYLLGKFRKLEYVCQSAVNIDCRRRKDEWHIENMLKIQQTSNFWTKLNVFRFWVKRVLLLDFWSKVLHFIFSIPNEHEAKICAMNGWKYVVHGIASSICIGL